MKRLPAGCLALLVFWFACATGLADEISVEEPLYVVDIELETVEDLRQLLERAEQLLAQGRVAVEGQAAVTFVLHGPVVRSLLRQNYLANKRTVDLAASLSALGVVDLKACRTWMGGNRVDETQLQPFVQTVAFGPGEVRRLVREQGYIYF